ncbi:MAG: 4Fe-4S binding protein [Candidatus Merdivicinus sp.]|jgi:ferredoxin
MKSTAIYFSATDTSKKGAEAIAAAIGGGKFETINLTRFDAVPVRTEFRSDEAVVFGAPVYGGRLYRGAVERFRKLKGNQTPCILTVTYGNRDFDDALLELSDLAKELGFVPVAAAALIGEHTYGEIQKGRPNAEDLAEDAVFAEKVAQKLAANDFSQPMIPGNHPYKEGGSGGKFHPLTAENCVKCGLCARECPEGAIDPANGFAVNPERCIACFRCIRRCPVHAKNMNTPEYQEFAAAFTKRLAERKENRYFL